MEALVLQFAGWYDMPAARGTRLVLKNGARGLVRYSDSTDELTVVPPEGDGEGAVALIVAGNRYWCLTNLHGEDTYFVENMERSGEFVKVPARRQNVPIPFELARLVVPVPRGTGVFDVYGPEPSYLDTPAATATNWPKLDEGTTYFRVLVALCEPQLRGYPPGAVPTVSEVIARLADAPAEISRAAVNHHINYLATEKLRVTSWAGTGGRRSYWKREAVVAMALRSGLVDERHLRLLPARSVTVRQCSALSWRRVQRSRPVR